MLPTPRQNPSVTIRYGRSRDIRPCYSALTEALLGAWEHVRLSGKDHINRAQRQRQVRSIPSLQRIQGLIPALGHASCIGL